MASLCYIKWPHHHFFNESPVLEHFCCHSVFLALLVGQLLKSLLGTLSPPALTFTMTSVKSVLCTRSVQGWAKDMTAWFADLVFRNETISFESDFNFQPVWKPWALPQSMRGYKTSFLHSFKCLSLVSWRVLSGWGSYPQQFLLSGIECSLFSIWFDCYPVPYRFLKNILSRVYNCYLWSG